MHRDNHLPIILGTILFATIVTLPGALKSAPDPSDSRLCDLAAARISAETGVPENVLRAITRTETARQGAPWPWTVNMEGDGHWFDTRAEAVAFATGRQRGGARSFDIGCFQVNHHWHGEHFPNINAMFEPVDNARYAAQFLIRLYQEMGSWDGAVGAYHSRTDRFAARYLRIYHGHLEALGGRPDMPPPGAGHDAQTTDNSYPFLRAGASGSLGSLVPQGYGSTDPLLGGGQ